MNSIHVRIPRELLIYAWCHDDGMQATILCQMARDCAKWSREVDLTNFLPYYDIMILVGLMYAFLYHYVVSFPDTCLNKTHSIYYEVTKACYFVGGLESSMLPWAESEALCQREGLGGHLTDILDQDEQVYLWPLLLTWFNFNPSMDK